MEFKLITWNVRQGGRPTEQVPRLLDRSPDVIALQEVKPSTGAAWAATLAEAGFAVETTLHLVGDRTYGLVLASRLPMLRLTKQRVEIPYPELLLSALVELPDGRHCEIHNTHVPNGSANGYRKVEHYEGLYRYLVRPIEPGRPRILCGDFNGPQRERPDGTVISWAQTDDGTRLQPDRGQRWDAAERSVFRGLAPFGLNDVYRDVHGYTRAEDNLEVSWVASNGRGRRFDHVFADPMLKPWGAEYVHEWRDPEKLSDHSALEVTFSAARNPRPPRRARS